MNTRRVAGAAALAALTAGASAAGQDVTQRALRAEDLKGLAALLASEASRHITGQAIAVDGGATII